VTATLVGVLSGLPVIDGEIISFSFGEEAASQTAATFNGVATVSVVYPRAIENSATVTFQDDSNYYADRNGAIATEVSSATAVVPTGGSALAALTVPINVDVDNDLTVSTTLSRTSAPAGPVKSVVVTFTFSGPSSFETTSVTDAAGFVSATFPSVPVRGSYTVVASYAGDACLVAASTSATVPVYQRISIVVNPATGVCADPFSSSASVSRLPGGESQNGGTVTFGFAGAIADVTGVAIVSGVTATTVTFATPGDYPVTVTHTDSDFYTDALGDPAHVQPAVGTGSVSVGFAATTLSFTAVPTTLLNGGVYTTSAKLTRATGNVKGAQIVFTVTASAGGAVFTRTAPTDAAGVSTVSFPASTFVAGGGAYTVVASFAGDTCQVAASTATVSFVVSQTTALSVSPATLQCRASVVVTSTLTYTPQNIPAAAGLNVVLSSGSATCTAVTLADGTATCTLAAFQLNEVTTTSLDGAFAATGFVLGSSGASTVTASTASTTLNTLTVPTTGAAATAMTVSAKLSRADGTSVAGAAVEFSLDSDVLLGPITATGIANGAGVATAIFPAASFPAGGIYTVCAAAAGDTCLLPASAGSAPPTTVTQYVSLTAPSPVTVTCQDPHTYQATLKLVPQNVPAPDAETIVFSDGTNSCSDETDGSGVAGCSLTEPSAPALVTVTASFADDFFASATTPATVNVITAPTRLSGLAFPSSVQKNKAFIAFVLLSRGTRAIVGATVTFTLTPSIGSQVVLSAVTLAGGLATVTFPTNSLQNTGTFTLVAAYSPNNGCEVGTSVSGSGTVTGGGTGIQDDVLTSTTAAATCGAGITVSAFFGKDANHPTAGQTITFYFSVNQVTCSGVTNAAGIASCTTSAVTATPAGVTVVATFAGSIVWAPNVVSFNVPTTGQPSSLTLTSAPVTAKALGLTAVSVLTSAGSPAPAGSSIKFTIAAPGQPTRVLSGLTDVNGRASVTFGSTLLGGGVTYAVTSAYAGGNGCLSSSTAGPVSVLVSAKQAVSISAPAVTVGCPRNAVLVATVTLTPQGTPPATPITVTFQGSNGAGKCDSTTNAQGVATCTLTGVTKSSTIKVQVKQSGYENGATTFAATVVGTCP